MLLLLPALTWGPCDQLAVIPHPSGPAETGDGQVVELLLLLLFRTWGGDGRREPRAREAGWALQAVGFWLVSLSGCTAFLCYHRLGRTVRGWGRWWSVNHLLIGRQQITWQEPWKALHENKKREDI